MKGDNYHWDDSLWYVQWGNGKKLSEVKAEAEYWEKLQCYYLEKSLLNSVTEPLHWNGL